MLVFWKHVNKLFTSYNVGGSLAIFFPIPVSFLEGDGIGGIFRSESSSSSLLKSELNI